MPRGKRFVQATSDKESIVGKVQKKSGKAKEKKDTKTKKRAQSSGTKTTRKKLVQKVPNQV